MVSAIVTNVASKKYIVLSKGSYEIHNKKYNYDKIKIHLIPKFWYLCKKIKLKQWKYIFVFLMSTRDVEKIWNAIARIKLIKPHTHA